MSDLLSSLRSLLPQEYVRGQSSSYDDIEEATKYIKDLEISIKELQGKRDMLKKPSSSSSSSSTSIISPTTNRDVNDNYVTIHTSPSRLEIETSVKVEEGNVFPLSKLLKQVSLVDGLEVVNCVSSKVDDKWKCIIHCTLVNDHANTDFTELQRRLANEISSYVN